MSGLLAAELIERLALEPHPEGGWYRRVFAHDRTDDAGRPLMTAIVYLLAPGDRSHWHRLDATELWHHLGGGPLELSTWQPGEPAAVRLLGLDLMAGEQPVVEVPAGWWQSARPLGELALVSCTVSPGFDFAGFSLAPPGWSPGAGDPERTGDG